MSELERAFSTVLNGVVRLYTLLINPSSDSGLSGSDPLDYSYEVMRSDLNEVKQSIADTTTQKKRLEVQKRRLKENIEKHDEQVDEAIKQDREMLARNAAAKMLSKEEILSDLENQVESIGESLEYQLRRKRYLQQRLEKYRAEKESMKARLETSKASHRIDRIFQTKTAEPKNDTDEIAKALDRVRRIKEADSFNNLISKDTDIDRADVEQEVASYKNVDYGEGLSMEESEEVQEPKDSIDTDSESVTKEITERKAEESEA